jgi:hypothetical protein
MTALRSSVVSSFTVIKGAMIPETYAALGRWDVHLTKAENLDLLRQENYIGSPSDTWLRDVAKVLNRRLDPNGRDLPLVTLARGGCPIDDWKPIYLWHITRDEFLVRDFLQSWLFQAYDDGAYRVRPDDLHQYLSALPARGGKTEHAWAEATLDRVATGLLRIASDFGLLTSGSVKQFMSYHIPDRSLVYLLHAILAEERDNPRRMIDSHTWRMYLMRSSDLERLLLGLHQFKIVDYQAAGSLVQLGLPCETALEYAKKMVA